MLLTQARAAARVSAEGGVVLLADQDRAHWDRALIDEGQEQLRICLRRNHPGIYQLQACIAAVHSDASSAEATDWPQIMTIYDQLLALSETPVIMLNRAVVRAELGQTQAALAEVEALSLDHYYLYHAVRGDLLDRLGRRTEAAQAFASALNLTGNRAEQLFLQGRVDALQP